MEVLQDQEKVRSMLLETVSLLCKSGLHFSSEISIEGLIGVTVDKKEIFLVNFKDIIEERPRQADSNEIDSKLSDTRSVKSQKRLLPDHTKSDNVNSHEDGLGSLCKKARQENAGFDLTDTTHEEATPELVKTDPDSRVTFDEGLAIVKEELHESYIQRHVDTSLTNQGDGDYIDDILPSATILSSSSVPSMPSNQSLQITPAAPGSAVKNTTCGSDKMELVVKSASDRNDVMQGHQGSQGTSIPGAYPYCCTLCQRVFSGESDMQVHAQLHMKGIYRYRCQFCNKAFSASTNLKGHIAQHHTQTKDYKCSVCNKGYAYYASLQYHMKSHTRKGKPRSNVNTHPSSSLDHQ